VTVVDVQSEASNGILFSLGTVNADFAVRIERVPAAPGSYPARDLLRTSGGRAANAAVAARRLGSTTVLLGCVGDDDLAEQALAGPRREGVDLIGVRRVAAPTGYVSVLVPLDGDKTMIFTPNANCQWPADDEQAIRRDIGPASPGSVLVLDVGIPLAIVRAAAAEARQRGVVVVLDPAPANAVADDLIGVVDHITPNHREAAELTGVDATDVDGARRAAVHLRDRGVGAAYVKLAKGGCALASAAGTQVIKPPAGLRTVDTTGAGDAFAGALAWAVLAGHDPPGAATLAVAASAFSVGGYGAQESYPTLEQLCAMAARVADANDGERGA
jgi:ribokinase